MLNVGGRRLVVLREVLLKAPLSRLACLFEGRWDSGLPRDSVGRIHLDLEPDLFIKLVAFLRDCPEGSGRKNITLFPQHEVPFKLMLDFLQLTTYVYGDSGEMDMFGDSLLLQGQPASQIEALHEWLPQYPSSKLLYRASRDGWQATEFHQKCDGQGPTLTLVRSGGYLFGGFTSVPWSSSGGYKPDPSAFLVSLEAPDAREPTKMAVKQDQLQHSVYHNGNFGPTFGRGYGDLKIYNNANTDEGSYSSLGNTYQRPANANSNYLAGSHDFTPSEIEVCECLE